MIMTHLGDKEIKVIFKRSKETHSNIYGVSFDEKIFKCVNHGSYDKLTKVDVEDKETTRVQVYTRPAVERLGSYKLVGNPIDYSFEDGETYYLKITHNSLDIAEVSITEKDPD
jgi:hypothetical protein